MGTHMRANTESRIRQSLHARKLTQGRHSILCVLGVIVVLGVVSTLMQSVLAAKSKDRVLDCHVSATVAHHHTSDCYDKGGDLVCTLPERDLHKHSKSCYERKLTCTTPEGEGAHHHDDSCRDADGNLICGLEESDGHQHTDACYTEELVCGKEEVTEEHVHTDACFRAIKTDDDAAQTAEPDQSFYEELTDKHDKPVMTVDVTAPEGALPKGATMEAELVDTETIDKDALQKAVDKKAARLDTLEPGRVLDFQAVDISFKDADGKTVEPKKDVTVKLTSELAESEDATVVLRMDGANADDSKDAPKAEVVDTLSEKQALRHGTKLADDQVAFDAARTDTYVLANTSTSGELSVKQTNATITLNASAEAGIPADATLRVDEIDKSDKGYDGYLKRSTEATELDRNDVGLARFFDITILDTKGNEIQPASPVDVRIEIEDAPEKAEDFKLVHFAEDAEGNESEAPEEVTAGGERGTTTFTAESFSVYGVIYTVDFGYEVGDKTYEFSIKGGESISLEGLADKLHLYESVDKTDDAKQFAEAADKVEFSNPELMWVGKVEGKKCALDIEQENDFLPEYAADVTDEDWKELVNRSYTDEWVLIARKPFSTTETLTITLDDGSEVHVKVTDNAPHKEDANGRKTQYVETIANPGVTKIDLFDYWIDSENGMYRGAWPGHRGDWNFIQYRHNQEQGQYIWNQQGDALRGGGNWRGINWNGQYNGGRDYGEGSGSHPLKFVPGADHTVWDENGRQNTDGNGDINSYSRTADPHQGIVANRLDQNGYPQLSGRLGGNSESLDYLFDPKLNVNGKRSYPDVNHFLYVDESDGYYTYDSNEVEAEFDKDRNIFIEQTQTGTNNEDRGFWPFKRGNWHFGMHVQTEFIMPEGGMVPNKAGTQNVPMEFTFAGDDDAWVFIDGVLVGDGGGIHNGTVIHIDFSDGSVRVTGREDSRHPGGFESNTNLSRLFSDAGVSGSFDGNTFTSGGHHTFDFFYLERGGSESNILLRYNLLAMTDFQAKKRYLSQDHSGIAQDQFQFSLIGVDGRFDKNGNVVDPNERAIMPSAQDRGWKDSARTIPNGSSNNPSLMHLDDYVIDTGVPDPNNPGQNIKQTLDLQMYTTGNLAGLDEAPVLFGEALIPKEVQSAYDADPSDPPRYRYIVMEQVPPNAMNAEGKRWKDANAKERSEGGFYDGTVLYDGTVYYMECVVDKRQANGGEEFYLKRIFYKNARFDEKIDDDVELTFTNKYVKPFSLIITKTNDADDPADVEYLQGAEFAMTYAQKVSDNPVKYQSPAGGITLAVKTDANGKASLPAVPPGTYLLRETKAPDNYKQTDTVWLLEFQEVDSPDPHVEPVITELAADGTMPANPKVIRPQVTDGTMEQGGRTIEVSTAPLTIENEENASFRLKLQKLWDGVDGTSSALDDSEVTVKLGRYKVGEKLGTLIVEKTGVPHDAHTIIFYTIDRVNPDYTTTEYLSGWYNATWPDGSPYHVEVPVEATDAQYGTTYKVTETVYSDDPRYVAVHNQGSSNVKYVTVYASTPGTASFTASYTERKEHIFLKTTLDAGSYNVDTSNVTYALYNLNESDSTPVATWSYDDVVSGQYGSYDPSTGLDLGEFLAGDYRMVESGWPTVADSEVDHTPELEANGTSVDEFSLAMGNPITSEFETTYHAKTPCDVEVYFYKKGEAAPTTPADTFTVYGNRAQIVFQGIPGANTDYNDASRDKATDHTIAGEGAMSCKYDIQWDAQGTDNPTRGTIDVDLPQRAPGATTRGPLKVYIGTDEADLDDFSVTSCTEIASTGFQSGRSGAGASGQARSGNGSGAKAAKRGGDGQASDKGRGTLTADGARTLVSLAAKSGNATRLGATISAGHVAIPAGADSDPDLFMLWDGQGRPQAPAGKSYVDDTDFNDQGYTVTLSKSDADTTVSATMWEKTVEDRDKFPALDANGDAYVYYIMGVRELEMPKGTECTIVKDGDKQQVSKYIDQDTDPAPLQVKNKVGQPTDIELIKVDKDDPTKTLAGAKFHIEMQDEDTQQWVRMKGGSAPAVKVIGAGTDVALDSDGVFEVPAAGVVVKDLEGGTYRFVEDACPAGYVMDDTEFEFEVGQDGVITSAYKAQDTDACITVKIPNTPGSELPHAGGIGETLFTVIGCALMAAGALMLLKRQRCEA